MGIYQALRNQYFVEVHLCVFENYTENKRNYSNMKERFCFIVASDFEYNWYVNRIYNILVSKYKEIDGTRLLQGFNLAYSAYNGDEIEQNLNYDNYKKSEDEKKLELIISANIYEVKKKE